MNKMIHIVFQEADVAVLKEAIKLDDSLQGDVIQIKDDFAVGPLKDIYTDEGMSMRKEWWREVLAGGDIDGKVDDGSVEDEKTVKELKEKLNIDADMRVWI